jgi:hypothetical protein
MLDQEIARRMDAYRGNPQGLMQRYQQSQQLIDLLALQKLKSEKEAAARSMQMVAGQQQPPTVAQQREQEVFDMTKQEVAQRVGGVAQQRAAKERQAMQRMLQGIASAPGAENVMPPQAMAAGGIVAFQAGGDIEDMPPIEALGEDVDETRRRLNEARRKLLTYGTRQQKEDRKGFEATQQAVKDLTERERDVSRRYEDQYQGGLFRPVGAPIRTRNYPQPVEQPAASSGVSMEQAMEEALGRAAPQVPVQTPPAAAPAAVPAPAAAPATTPAAPAGVAALQAPQGMQELQAALMAALKPDRAKMIEQYRSMVPGVNQERLAARQKELSELEKRFQEESDPKRQLMRDLTAFFLGGAGKTTNAGALAGAARDYLRSSDAQKEAQRARLKELMASREGLRALEEARELEQAKAGLEGLKSSEAGVRSALPSAASFMGSQLQAQVSRDTAEAQRAQKQADILTRQADNALRREQIDRENYLDFLQKRNTHAEKMFKALRENFKNNKLTDEQLRASVNASLRDFDQRLELLARKANMPEMPRNTGMNLPSASAIEAELRRREGK